ncbi:MAG: hypothetical protein OHK0017_00820 [Patescibacteria group bacterium]
MTNNIPTIKFCEDNLDGWVAQPANTFSHFMFFGVATWMFWLIVFQLKKTKLKYNTELIKFAYLLPVCTILLGIGSSIYHATYTRTWQFADLSGMMFVIAWVIGWQSKRYLKNTSPWLSFGVVGLLTILPTFVSHFILVDLGKLQIGEVIFFIATVSSVGLEIRHLYKTNWGNLKYYLIAPSLLGFGWFWWWLDLTRVWCDPSTFHYINGHAIWHIFSAASIGAIFWYYFHDLSGDHKIKNNI